MPRIKLFTILLVGIVVERPLPADEPGLGNRPGHPARPVHTYSIVARDAKTGEIGVAVQSHWFAIGPAQRPRGSAAGLRRGGESRARERRDDLLARRGPCQYEASRRVAAAFRQGFPDGSELEDAHAEARQGRLIARRPGCPQEDPGRSGDPEGERPSPINSPEIHRTSAIASQRSIDYPNRSVRDNRAVSLHLDRSPRIPWRIINRLAT